MTLLDVIRRDGYLLGDGAMGTMLQDAGLDDGGAPELWNLEKPDIVSGILDAYAAAGAGYLTTCTFGGSGARLAMHGLDDQVHRLNEAGALLARRVADKRGILVAGNVGPTGELLFPVGTLEPDDATELFTTQIGGLIDGGCDFILIETMSDLSEVEAAVAAARRVIDGVPIMATMSFDTNLRTMMGVKPAQAVQRLAAAGVDVVGANCGRGPNEMRMIMREMRDAQPDGVLLGAQSNAGLPRPVADRFEYDATPEVMAAWAVAMLRLGVTVIGGCCGTTPRHIAAMRDALASE